MNFKLCLMLKRSLWMKDLRSKTLFVLWQQQQIKSLIIMASISLLTEDGAEEPIITEVVEVAEDLMVVNPLNSIPLNLLPSTNFNKFSLIPVEVDQRDQYVRFVERLDIWLLIVITRWTMLIKESILLPSLQLWPLHLMPVSLKINPSLLTVLQQTMLPPVLTISAFLNLAMGKTILL